MTFCGGGGCYFYNFSNPMEDEKNATPLRLTLRFANAHTSRLIDSRLNVTASDGTHERCEAHSVQLNNQTSPRARSGSREHSKKPVWGSMLTARLTSRRFQPDDQPALLSERYAWL